MFLQCLMAVVVIALHRCFLQSPVHPLDLAVGPRMVRLGSTVLDLVFPAHATNDMREGRAIPLPVRALDAVVGQDNVDAVRHGRNEIP